MAGNVRLTQLLGRLGLPRNATEVDLRSAYYRQAKNVHPDSGGVRASQAHFITLKQDFDEALKLISVRATQETIHVKRHSTAGAQERNAAWSEDTGSGPTGISMSWLAVFGGLFVGAAVTGSVRSDYDTGCNLDTDQSTKPISAKPQTNAPCRIKQDLSKPQNGYYKSRVAKSEPHISLQKRPHAKQRGLLRIPPIHQAAEDGLAEWMHYAGERSGSEVFKMLDGRGQTPLHYCARAGQRDACAVALKYYCDPHARDNSGKTPLDLARDAGHAEIFEMLQSGRRPLSPRLEKYKVR